MKQGHKVPDVIFKTRVRDESIGGDNPFRWQDVSTTKIFNGKRVVIFSLPGAFTPTCSTYQVPGFEDAYEEIRSLGIDEVYVVSVNDTFVMRKWMIDQEVDNIKFIPDGNGEFTEGMGMLVDNSTWGLANVHGVMRQSSTMVRLRNGLKNQASVTMQWMIHMAKHLQKQY